VKSPSVFADYYKQHDKFLADSKHGYQTVGDIAYRDDEGYLYICDRKKDMIISGGMNIYPAEIEAALEHHADVLEVAVFGTPSDEWGENVHAVVVVREGATMTDHQVMDFAREHLAHYKVPKLGHVHRRAPEDRQRQGAQARTARPVLGRPHQPGLTPRRDRRRRRAR
jgi:acyl-CoA synthetase (AMP-forming)/AMP-acid ligase II